MSNVRPWWHGAVLYQVYPRSFLDTTGTGVGDLNGIIERLDHIADLGVDGLWMSPINPSPMKDFGYDVSDYRTVHPLYGSDRDLDGLIKAAGDRGLRVLLDLVICHTSDQHGWFRESRTDRNNDFADWYVWADARPDGGPPNNWLSVFGGPAWTWDSGRGQYYYHAFLPSQPSLNIHHSDVVAELCDTLRHWLDRGVDGFRLDAITALGCDPLLRSNPARSSASDAVVGTGAANNPFWMQDHIHDRDIPHALSVHEALRRTVDAYAHEPILMGEVGDVDAAPAAAKYAAPGRLHTTYNFDLITAAPDTGAMVRAAARTHHHLGDGWMTWTLGNHDTPRLATRMGAAMESAPEIHAESARRAVLAQAWCLSLRGLVSLYQGDELALPEADLAYEDLVDPFGIAFYPAFKGRDGCRVPLPWSADHHHGGFTTGGSPWLPIPEALRSHAADRQSRDPASPLSRLSQFLGWRKSMPVLRHGAMDLGEVERGVLAVRRRLDDQQVIGVFNFTDDTFEIDIADAWSSLSGHGFEGHVSNGRLHVPAHDAAFLAADAGQPNPITFS